MKLLLSFLISQTVNISVIVQDRVTITDSTVEGAVYQLEYNTVVIDNVTYPVKTIWL